MKLPRISVGALMTGLVVFAFDCVVARSILARPYDRGLTLIAFVSLPMANVLSVGVARLVGGQVRSRRSLVGFEVGGWCALIVMILGIEPALGLLEVALRATGLGRMLNSSLIAVVVLQLLVLGVLPILFPLLIGLAGGRIACRFGGRAGPAPEASPGPGRRPVLALVVLVVLVALPALVVEGILRRDVDAPLVRLAEGSEAVVDLEDPWGIPGTLPPRSPVKKLDKAKVRIEKDGGPNQVELARIGRTTLVRDLRPVEVKVLDGPRAGESAGVPYHMLRPIR